MHVPKHAELLQGQYATRQTDANVQFINQSHAEFLKLTHPSQRLNGLFIYEV